MASSRADDAAEAPWDVRKENYKPLKGGRAPGAVVLASTPTALELRARCVKKGEGGRAGCLRFTTLTPPHPTPSEMQDRIAATAGTDDPLKAHLE